MSPEQITNPRVIDHRTDVYSMGIVLYEMLTGRLSFVRNQDGVGDSDFAIQLAHIQMKPRNPKSLVPTIAPELDRLVMTALEKEPDKRFAGCGEFARALANQLTFGKVTGGVTASIDGSTMSIVRRGTVSRIADWTRNLLFRAHK
jgi:serine/threonine protein kinase